jgi:hypothetical protein
VISIPEGASSVTLHFRPWMMSVYLLLVGVGAAIAAGTFWLVRRRVDVS